MSEVCGVVSIGSSVEGAFIFSVGSCMSCLCLGRWFEGWLGGWFSD